MRVCITPCSVKTLYSRFVVQHDAGCVLATVNHRAYSHREGGIRAKSALLSEVHAVELHWSLLDEPDHV